MFENEMTHPWYVVTRAKMIATLLQFLKKDAKILDAGCGTGGTIKFLGNEGFRNVIGVDNSPLALKLAKKRAIKNLRLAVVDNLPFKDGIFDAVICLDVLYHRGVDPQKALLEFARILKKEGVLYLQEPSYQWLRGSHDIAIETARRFSLKTLKRLVDNCGFKIKKITHFNTLFFLLIFLKRFFETKNKKVSSDVGPVPPLLSKIFLLVLKTEGSLTNYLNLPFGLSIIVVCQKK